LHNKRASDEKARAVQNKSSQHPYENNIEEIAQRPHSAISVRQGKQIMKAIDIGYVRNQFPAFKEEYLAGVSHFDNAGGSYACGPVIEWLSRYYRETKVQPYGVHPVSRRAGQEMDSAHRRLAEYLGIDAEEVHLGPSTSQNTFVLAQAISKRLQPGDEIIVTNQDHEANSGVWRRLADQGMVIREWRINPETGTLDPDDLDTLLGTRTKVVAFPHCSNLIGEINPVPDICARVHRTTAVAVVDGVSYAPHGLPDVRQLGADIYLFSLYKVFGPHLGAIAMRRNVMEWLGNQGHYFNGAYVHKWFVPAGPDHAQVAATNGVADYFDALHSQHNPDADSATKAAAVRALLRCAELTNLRPLLDFCRNDPRVRLIGPDQADQRAPTVSVQTLTASPQEIAARLADHGIIAGAGHFYAVRPLEALGIDPNIGVLRLSFVHYTSQAEIEHLLTTLDRVL
jgi:cysteine desulfurase family protein (TIGR01976 family)